MEQHIVYAGLPIQCSLTLTAADLLNDRAIPFYEEPDIPLQRVLTDRGTEYCGTHDRHEYELYLAVENIDHTRTKALRTEAFQTWRAATGLSPNCAFQSSPGQIQFA